METRTKFTIRKGTVISCDFGTAKNFAIDMAEFVVPFLDDEATIIFNDREVKINNKDIAESIFNKLQEKLS